MREKNYFQSFKMYFKIPVLGSGLFSPISFDFRLSNFFGTGWHWLSLRHGPLNIRHALNFFTPVNFSLFMFCQRDCSFSVAFSREHSHINTSFRSVQLTSLFQKRRKKNRWRQERGKDRKSEREQVCYDPFSNYLLAVRGGEKGTLFGSSSCSF